MMILIGVGGALGAVSRFMIGQFLYGKNPNTWMNGTWVVNLTGSFILGVLASLYVDGHLQTWVWYIAGAGFCGAFTTFSTFSVETLKMLQENRYNTAFLYVTTTLLFGLIAAAIGFYI